MTSVISRALGPALRVALWLCLVAAAVIFVLAARSWPDPSVETRDLGLPYTRSAQCRECHAEIYDEWAASYHALAWRDAVYQRERHLTVPGYCDRCHEEARGASFARDARGGLLLSIADCLSGKGNEDCSPCHVPFSMYATGIGKRVVARFENRHEGVDCVVCHLEPGQGMNGGIQAPLRRPGADCRPMFDARQRSTAMCEPCHNQHETCDEWRNSDYAPDRDCASCHMETISRPIVPGGPIRRAHSHRFPGAHDMARWKNEVLLQIARPDDDGTLAIVLQNLGVGHNFPTDTRYRVAELRIAVRDRATGRELPLSEYLALSESPSPVPSCRGMSDHREGEGTLIEHLQFFFRDQGGLRNTLRPFEERVYRFAIIKSGPVRLYAKLLVRLTPLSKNDAPALTTLFLEDEYDLQALPTVARAPKPRFLPPRSIADIDKDRQERKSDVDAEMDASLRALAPKDPKAGFAPLSTLLETLAAQGYAAYDAGGQPRAIPEGLMPSAEAWEAWLWHVKELLFTTATLQKERPEGLERSALEAAGLFPQGGHLPWHQTVAAMLAAHMAETRLVRYLALLLRDPSPEVQGVCAYALGMIGDRAALVDLAERRFHVLDRKLSVENGDLTPVSENLVGIAWGLLGSKHAIEPLYQNWAGDPVRFAGNLAWIERFLGRTVPRDDPMAAFQVVADWQQGEDWYHGARHGQAPDRTDLPRFQARVRQHIDRMAEFSYYAADRSRKVLTWLDEHAVPVIASTPGHESPVVRQWLVQILTENQVDDLILLLGFLLDDDTEPVRDQALLALTAFDAAEMMQVLDLRGSRFKRDFAFVQRAYPPEKLAEVLAVALKGQWGKKRLAKTLRFLGRARLPLPAPVIESVSAAYGDDEQVAAALERYLADFRR